MLKRLILAAGCALALMAQASAADPQRFTSEDSATKFCHKGDVVWFNPDSKIYFEQGSQYYAKTKQGGFTCRAFAEKSGFKASKGH